MSARAMWKGTLVLEEVRIPVKLYSAVEDRKVRFRLLHAEDRVPLRQRMINPRTGRAVEHREAERGLEVERDVFVRLTPDELEELEPPPSRDVRVLRFVPPEAITHQWYDRPYYLAPDGAEEEYAALVRALSNRERQGVVQWVMRKKRYLGALRAERERLALLTLRTVEEVITASDLEAPEGRELEARERDMAEKFVGALSDRFDPGAYRDEYRERVAELIEMKRRGETVEMPEYYEEKPEPEELTELLEASLRQLA